MSASSPPSITDKWVAERVWNILELLLYIEHYTAERITGIKIKLNKLSSRSNDQDQPSQHSVFISPRSRFANELIDRDTNANASTASATSTVMSDSHYDRDYDHDHDYDHAHNHDRDVYIDPEGTPVVV